MYFVKDGLKISKCEWPLSFEGKLVSMATVVRKQEHSLQVQF